jgi:hypothetical protein
MYSCQGTSSGCEETFSTLEEARQHMDNCNAYLRSLAAQMHLEVYRLLSFVISRHNVRSLSLDSPLWRLCVLVYSLAEQGEVGEHQDNSNGESESDGSYVSVLFNAIRHYICAAGAFPHSFMRVHVIARRSSACH